jgi:hypothetical protein
VTHPTTAEDPARHDTPQAITADYPGWIASRYGDLWIAEGGPAMGTAHADSPAELREQITNLIAARARRF